VKLVTWNVNSLRIRLDRVRAWLEAHAPDVVCVQETKCPDDDFPRDELAEVGYEAAFTGEKGLNGVAILSREPLTDVETVLPGGVEDAQRRYIAGRLGDLKVMNVYVPNGQAVGSEAFFYKLDWLSRLQAHLVSGHDPAAPLALVGDFNVAPADLDVHDPAAWAGRLHCTAHERRAIGYLEAWGLTDALRHVRAEERVFSWFDYRATYGGFDPAEGLRIDLILLTGPLRDRLRDVTVDLDERAGTEPKPSDHAPVIAHLD